MFDAQKRRVFLFILMMY